MIEKVRKNWIIGIWAGIIGTAIFLYFLDPIVGFFARILLRCGEHVAKAYINRLYAEIATGQIEYGFLFYITLRIILIVVFLEILCKPWLKLKFARTVAEGEHGELDLKQNKWRRRLNRAIFNIVIVIVIVLCLLGVTDGYIRLKTATTFDQHIKVIAPHITDQEEEEILAQYTSMRNRNDYKDVCLRIEEIARENDIKLPPNKLYGF